jgi:hypothetical protein
MATATAMYHSGRDALRKITRKPRSGDEVVTPRGKRHRDLHKAFLRWHDRKNWPALRAALEKMGREDLIGTGPDCLVPGLPRPQAEPGRKKAPGKKSLPRTGRAGSRERKSNRLDGKPGRSGKPRKR